MEVSTDRRKLWGIIGVWALAVLTALGLFIYSSLSFVSAEALRQKAAAVTGTLYKTIFINELSDSARNTLAGAAAFLIPLCGFAFLALFIWWALRLGGFPFRRTVYISFGISVVCAGVDMLYQLSVPGRYPTAGDIAVDLLGIVIALFCVLLGRLLWLKCPRLYNWETINYVIFGVLTTIVNIVVNGICTNLNIFYILSTTIAWVLSVLFAYIVNKLFVFHSHNTTKLQVLREFALFIGARVLSYGVDVVGMTLLFVILHINNGVSKIMTNVIVMIMNYFFSKWIIFKKTEE